jgi:hypothetical protein
MHKMRLVTGLFGTDRISGDHNPKSTSEPDANCSVTELYARAWIVVVCVNLSIPWAALLQMMTVLSAPPDAKRVPSAAYDKQ